MTDYDSIYKRGAPPATDLVDKDPPDLVLRCSFSDCDAPIDIHILKEDDTMIRRERCDDGHESDMEIVPIERIEILGP